MHMTEADGESPLIVLTRQDKADLKRLLKSASSYTNTPQLEAYKSLSSDDLWWRVVVQICVRGSARQMEKLEKNPQKLNAAKEALSLANVSNGNANSVIKILREHGMTRFHNKASQIIYELSQNNQTIKKSRVVLLDKLNEFTTVHEQRIELMRRCSAFSLKSASDFMISVGWTDDVIALDTRVVGAFNRCLGFDLSASKVQSNSAIYHAVEDALRIVCRESGSSLAVLDRTIFQLTSKSVVDFFLENKRQ